MNKNNLINECFRIIVPALIVGISSEVKFNVITGGFIIAMSVLLMELFLYCFENINRVRFVLCCAAVSPTIRYISEISSGGDTAATLTEIMPDAIFFIVYASAYNLFYSKIFTEGKTVRNFPITVFFSDTIGNLAELVFRSLVLHTHFIIVADIGLILAVALLRTLIVQLIILIIENYSNILLRHEMDEEFKRLIVQTSKLEGELYIIEKNIAEMEDVMKQAYSLYRNLEADENVPAHFKKEALSLARLIHEIKGDYKGVAEVLRTQFMYEFDNNGMKISDILNIEKKDVETLMQSKETNADIYVKVYNDFYVKPYFEMFSVIRNLLVNAAEAIDGMKNSDVLGSSDAEAGSRRCKIRLIVKKTEDEYNIEVCDDGPGMAAETVESIFLDGFSTKFDESSGNIQRGLGLPLVKHYTDEIFHGQLQVESEEGKFTRFLIRIPQETVLEWEKGYTDEVLHS